MPSVLPSSGASSTGSNGDDNNNNSSNFGNMYCDFAPEMDLLPPEPVQQQRPSVGTRTSSRRSQPPPNYSMISAAQTTISMKGRAKAAGKKRKNSKGDDTGKVTATKTKSQAQVDRRRERNRILARRTRLRKKFFFENLQAEVAQLQGQNIKLKEIVAQKLPKIVAETILKECQTELPQCVLEDAIIGSSACNEDAKFATSLRSSQSIFCISDPSLPDCPIVYCSPGFCELTGYDLSEILGRNCRFLQGPGTSLSKVAKLRDSISKGQDVSVTLLNYKKDGTAFWNSLFVASLLDNSGNVVNHIGVQAEVRAPPPGDPEFDKVAAEQQESLVKGEHGDSFDQDDIIGDSIDQIDDSFL